MKLKNIYFYLLIRRRRKNQIKSNKIKKENYFSAKLKISNKSSTYYNF